MQIKNEKYRAFLRGELMDTINREQFFPLLNAVKHKQLKQARVLCILMWMMAKRPNEILNITAGDISLSGKHIKIKTKGSKGGYSATTILPVTDQLVREVWDFSKDKFSDQFLFWCFRSKSKKQGAIKKIRRKQPDGTYIYTEKRYEKAYPNLSNTLWYWYNKWFKLPPYYFRHNRLTLAAGKLEANDLMLLKGARSMESIRPYIHYNEKAGKRMGAELVK